jgi:hypothetical protein
MTAGHALAMLSLAGIAIAPEAYAACVANPAACAELFTAAGEIAAGDALAGTTLAPTVTVAAGMVVLREGDQIVGVVDEATGKAVKFTQDGLRGLEQILSAPGPTTRYHKSGYRSEFYEEAGTAFRWRNPMNGRLEDIPSGVQFHKEHILPKKIIINELKGFETLSPAQKNKILNDPRNFQPMEGTLNCSKGCRVQRTDNEWLNYKGEPLDANYREWLGRQQDDIREYLEGVIDRMNRGLE